MAVVKPAQGAPNIITGDAKVIDAAMMTRNWPAAATRFLARLRLTTFGDQGFHRQAGEDEHFCVFDLAGWAQDMDMAPSQVLRTRARLVAAHIITFAPHPTIAGRGVVGWNMHVEEWERIGPKGGAHYAGNPHFHDPEYQAALHTLIEKNRASCTPAIYQNVNPDLSNCKSTLDAPSIKVLKDDCLEAAQGQAPPTPKKRLREERRSSATTVAGGAKTARTTARASPSKRSGKGRGREPLTDEEKAALKQYRADCFEFIGADYPKMPASERVKQTPAMEQLFRDHIPIEHVRGCWQALIKDPWFKKTGQILQLSKVKTALADYLNDPADFAARMEQLAQKGDNGNGKRSAHHRLPSAPKPGSLADWQLDTQSQAGDLGGSAAHQESATDTEGAGGGAESEESEDDTLRRLHLI